MGRQICFFPRAPSNLGTPLPVRKRLSWTHALRGMWHPGGELVKLEMYGFNESRTGRGSGLGL